MQQIRSKKKRQKNVDLILERKNCFQKYIVITTDAILNLKKSKNHAPNLIINISTPYYPSDLLKRAALLGNDDEAKMYTILRSNKDVNDWNEMLSVLN